MRTKKLNNWLEQLLTEADLVSTVYPSFPVLQKEAWATSNLGEAISPNNVLCNTFHELNSNDANAVVHMIHDIDDKDLVDILGIDSRELEARRGLALLQQTEQTVEALKEECTRKLRKIQAIRDVAIFESERRVRVKMIEAGSIESMEPFLARFLFGPEPTPMIPPDDKSGILRKREFFMARVKSGKQVAVENLHFNIPRIYNTWLMEQLRKAETVDFNPHLYHSTPPSTASFKIARIYYKLGFKPSKVVHGYYQVHWHTYSWSKGWSLSHPRDFNVFDIAPVD